MTGEAIRSVLESHLPRQGLVLELGSGALSVDLARGFPFVAWQPTHDDPAVLASLEVRRAEAALPNLLRPIALAIASTPWPLAKADAIVCIDTAHAMPWEAVVTLFEQAARVLPAGGMLHVLGPVRFYGKYAAAAVADLDWELRRRDPQLGIHDISALMRLASHHNIGMLRAVALPPHGHALTFKRDAMPPPTGRFQI